MNRRPILALLAAMVVSGALCAAVPQMIGRPAEPTPAETVGPATAGSQAPDERVIALAGSTTATATASAPASSPSTQSSVVQMRQRADQTRGTMVYIALLALLVVSGLGLPIPEEIPLLLAGYKAWHGAASLYFLIPIGLIGVLTADIMLFLAARRWRSHIFRLRWIRATIKPRHLVFVRDQFHKHGMKIVIVARWLPALRSAVCLTAGLTGVSTLHFLLVDATAACITVPASIFLGYFAANQIDRLIAGFVRAEHTVLLVVLLAAAAVVIYWFAWGRRKHERKKLAKPLPSQDGEESAIEETISTSPRRSNSSDRNKAG